MLHRSGSKSRMSSSGPTYMSNEQMGDYLHNLRSNPVARPKGSRPLPSAKFSRDQVVAMNEPANSSRTRSSLPTAEQRADQPYSRSTSLQSGGSPGPSNYAAKPTAQRQSSHSSYIERDSRQRERKEAHDLRLALQGIDLEDERRMHENASEEAAELIWKHQNPGAAYRLVSRPSESIPTSNDNNTFPKAGNTPHTVNEDIGKGTPAQRADQNSSDATACQNFVAKPVPVFASPTPINQLADKRRSSGSRRASGNINSRISFPSAEDRIYEDPPRASMERPAESSGSKPGHIPAHVRRNPFARARESRSARISNSTLPSSPRSQSDKSAEASAAQTTTATTTTTTTTNLNKILDPADLETNTNMAPMEDVDEEIRYRDGVEIRSDELRAATSMRLKDRSPRLPSPVIVTDNPERPIVSFRSDWTPPASEVQHSREARRQSVKEKPGSTPLIQINSETTPDAAKSPASHVKPSARNRDIYGIDRADFKGHHTPNSQPPSVGVVPPVTYDAPHVTVPVIQVEGTPPVSSVVPVISVDEPPPIVVSEAKQKSQSPLNTSTRPRIAENYEASAPDSTRPPHRNAAIATTRSQFHMTPSVRRQTALCAQCALPISGKIVSAVGARFHPECFTCFHCGEALECIAFYPEPSERRAERLARAERQRNGTLLEHEMDAPFDEQDGDDSLRFYCHLDYHEFFSPRCKSCKTPIEGEVIVACGAEWHVGHFFCAQCGDPFDPNTPFVERDGYAWCVSCHTNRTSARCKKCKKPVVDTVVKAMDAEWHEECFRCADCNSTFDDGRYFVKGQSQEPVCFMCGERRLKA